MSSGIADILSTGDYKTASIPQLDLTHCGLVTPYSTEISVNIGSGNSMLPDSTKP